MDRYRKDSGSRQEAKMWNILSCNAKSKVGPKKITSMQIQVVYWRAYNRVRVVGKAYSISSMLLMICSLQQPEGQKEITGTIYFGLVKIAHRDISCIMQKLKLAEGPNRIPIWISPRPKLFKYSFNISKWRNRHKVIEYAPKNMFPQPNFFCQLRN